jgi:uncharacterized protein with NAD-binding domain and iron-sulfur cluster
MKEKVVVIGGGIGGLTAAHELVDRGFEVHVYERKPIFGGKAASVRSGKDRLPGEHGFRFYPGWYRHLPDTMGRIPYRGKRKYYEGRTVLQNLVQVDRDLLVWYDRDPISVLMHAPRNLDEMKAHGRLVGELKSLGLAPGEIGHFAQRMLAFVTKSDAQQRAQFEGITWWDYLDAGNKSRAFREMMTATTRLMVAAKATEASAYTIGKLALRTFSDALSSVDRVLDGPTNEVWIDPWVQHLEERGVVFHRGWQLDSVAFHDDRPRVRSVRLHRVATELVTRLRRLCSSLRVNLSMIAGINQDPQRDEDDRGRRAQLLGQITADCASARALVAAIRDDDVCKQLLKAGKKAAEGPLQVLADLAGLPLATRLVERAARADTWSTELGEDRSAEKNLAAALGLGRAKVTDVEGTLALALQALASQAPPGKGAPTTFPAGWRAVLERVLGDDSAWGAFTAWIAGVIESPGAAANHRLDLVLERLGDRLQATEEHLGELEIAPEFAACTEEAEYFVFALPLEQMAYYVNRSATMTYHDPSLRKLILLAEHTDWMAGIQFYLEESFDLVSGHIVCMDSEWALTAIEETQFWKDVDFETTDKKRLSPPLKAVISVDIAAWDRKGHFVKKEAFNCSDDEIASEVWQELKAAINRDGRFRHLRDDMLRGASLQKNVSYHLDTSIVDLYDRKKQAAYERARSVRFSAGSLLARQKDSGHETATSFMGGGRLRFNVEPLLINRVGAAALRPEARTNIPNMFLAADYVRTETDLACMEGANEAARRAVNALLDAAGSAKPRCELWRLATPSDVVEGLGRLVAMGDGWGSAAGVAKTAGKIVDGLWNTAGQIAGEVLERRRAGNG